MKKNSFTNNNTTANNNSNNILGGITMNNITDVNTFAAVVKATVEASLGQGVDVEIREVLKNNATRLTGLSIRNEGSNIAPTIYLEGFFEQFLKGCSIDHIANEIIGIYETSKDSCPFDEAMLSDTRKATDKLYLKLINAERNKELLADAPHILVCDLAVVFFILVSNDTAGTATITVRNNMAALWRMTAEELFDIALDNTQRMFRGSVRTMASVMMEMLGSRLDEECCSEFYDMIISDEDAFPMYIATNDVKVNGAAVLLYNNLLKDFADRTGNDFYILPSSVHEAILVPVSDQMDPSSLRAMVREVNATQVAPAEVLSDNVYYYSRENDEISIA